MAFLFIEKENLIRQVVKQVRSKRHYELYSKDIYLPGVSPTLTIFIHILTNSSSLC